MMAGLVPGDGMSLVRTSCLMSLSNKHFLMRGLVFAIWTASSGFAAIVDGLDLVYRVRETMEVSIALGLTLLAGSLLLVAVGLMVDGRYLGRLGLQADLTSILPYLRIGAIFGGASLCRLRCSRWNYSSILVAT